ncbi:hypothetical protein [Rheinheimera texasensis]|uniref:hypothetical protein n=1 Tax=Rheinheimera texasensis TaxID=306205 RepID=UPI0032B1E9CD
MNIISATQAFSAREQQLFQQSRLEVQSSPVTRPSPATSPTAQAVDPQSETESKSSDEQNEDGQQFSAKESIGTVKRILEQLSTGKLLSWLDGSAFDKIQAQQQQIEAEATTPTAPTERTVMEFNYRYQAVEASFAGAVQLEDGSSQSFAFSFSLQESYASFSIRQEAVLKDPLIVSTTGQSFQWTGASQAFDFFSDGRNADLPTLANGQYYLSYDRNQDGQITEGKELFGPSTGQGFAELAALDEDKDGFVDSSDSAWQQLSLWRPGETPSSLTEAGIGALSAQSVATSFGLYDGDALLARIARSGIFLSEQGKVGLLQQVDLNI